MTWILERLVYPKKLFRLHGPKLRAFVYGTAGQWHEAIEVLEGRGGVAAQRDGLYVFKEGGGAAFVGLDDSSGVAVPRAALVGLIAALRAALPDHDAWIERRDASNRALAESGGPRWRSRHPLLGPKAEARTARQRQRSELRRVAAKLASISPKARRSLLAGFERELDQALGDR